MRHTVFHKSLKKMGDAELLIFFLEKNDTRYLGELYSRYIHLVYGVCLKYFKDIEKSKDAVINIYEKIQNEIHGHSVKNFKSWLYVVTKNHCLMELRKNKTGKIITEADDETISRFMENETKLHPIDEQHNNKETEKALADCIEKLKNDQKRCIRLFYFENKCYREIAGQMNTAEKKVKSFIQNGKRNLRICMQKKNEQQRQLY